MSIQEKKVTFKRVCLNCRGDRPGRKSNLCFRCYFMIHGTYEGWK